MKRIQKILSEAGVASRRKSEDLIKAGRVTKNGKIVQIGESAEDNDKISVDGKIISSEKKRYIALNKPKGYVTTVSDTHAKKKVVDLIKSKERLYPVGRLDIDAEGLLLMTNDGDFANAVMHPRYEVSKTYIAELDRDITNEDTIKLKNGVSIEGVKVECKAQVLDAQHKRIRISIHEGRHKIVKRIFKKLGYHVQYLLRESVGDVKLAGMQPGAWRELTSDEQESFSSGN